MTCPHCSPKKIEENEELKLIVRNIFKTLFILIVLMVASSMMYVAYLKFTHQDFRVKENQLIASGIVQSKFISPNACDYSSSQHCRSNFVIINNQEVPVITATAIKAEVGKPITLTREIDITPWYMMAIAVSGLVGWAALAVIILFSLLHLMSWAFKEPEEEKATS